MFRPARSLTILFLLLAPAVASAQSLDDAVTSTLGPWVPGMVVGLEQRDSIQLLEAFGHRAAHPDSALSTDDVFPFPGLSKVLVGVMAGVLDSAGLVDEDAPLSTYLPSLSPAVGRATLRELLTNTAGLDDAARMEGESWKKTLDRVEDDALVAGPGTLYSESRHSLPLAVRVIERVAERPFDELVSETILHPLGMSSSTFSLERARTEGLVRGVQRTNDPSTPTRLVEPVDTVAGLPVLFTTATDVLRFLAVWMAGRLRCPGPGQPPLVDVPDAAVSQYGSGASVRTYRGRRVVSVGGTTSDLGSSAGFYLLPRSRVVIVVWSVGEWPGAVANFTLSRVADALGAPAATAPAPHSSAGSDGSEVPLPDPAKGVGTYRNGDRIFVLRKSGGALVMFDGARELPLTTVKPNTLAAHLPDGRVALQFELLRDAEGRPYLYYRKLAYRRTDDSIGR